MSKLNFWEVFYLKHETGWGFDPSESALMALEYFKKNGVNKILIPGSGYGRNAKLFIDNGFQVTGIEISERAIRLAKENKLDFQIYHGSITNMPFENQIYDGIFCYATLHLFNKMERIKIIHDSFNQLKPGGFMFFNVVSEESMSDFVGLEIENKVLKLENGLQLTFYTKNRIEDEFKDYNIIEILKIDEPIKHMENQKALKCFNVICKKI